MALVVAVWGVRRPGFGVSVIKFTFGFDETTSQSTQRAKQRSPSLWLSGAGRHPVCSSSWAPACGGVSIQSEFPWLGFCTGWIMPGNFYTFTLTCRFVLLPASWLCFSQGIPRELCKVDVQLGCSTVRPGCAFEFCTQQTSSM